MAASIRAVISRCAHVEPAVHRRDDEVEPLKHLLLVVNPAILEDVGLDSLQHPEPAQPAVHLVDLVGLPRKVVRLEAAGVGRGLAVVGHAEIFVSRRLAGERQLLHGVGSIRVAGVAVQESLEILALQQPGQLLPLRPPQPLPLPSRSSGGMKLSPSAW